MTKSNNILKGGCCVNFMSTGHRSGKVHPAPNDKRPSLTAASENSNEAVQIPPMIRIISEDNVGLATWTPAVVKRSSKEKMTSNGSLGHDSKAANSSNSNSSSASTPAPYTVRRRWSLPANDLGLANGLQDQVASREEEKKKDPKPQQDDFIMTPAGPIFMEESKYLNYSEIPEKKPKDVSSESPVRKRRASISVSKVTSDQDKSQSQEYFATASGMVPIISEIKEMVPVGPEATHNAAITDSAYLSNETGSNSLSTKQSFANEGGSSSSLPTGNQKIIESNISSIVSPTSKTASRVDTTDADVALRNKTPVDFESESMGATISSFESDLKRLMRQEIFQPKELIIIKNTIGKEMYFLSKGTVEVVSKDGKEVYKTLHEGSFFGELGVLFSVPRTASVRALDRCQCNVLTREALESVLVNYPLIAERFRRVAEARMQEINSARSLKRQPASTVHSKMQSLREEQEDS